MVDNISQCIALLRLLSREGEAAYMYMLPLHLERDHCIGDQEVATNNIAIRRMSFTAKDTAQMCVCVLSWRRTSRKGGGRNAQVNFYV